MDNEIDLREIFQVLWRGKYLILGITALFILAVFLYLSFFMTQSFQSNAILDLSMHEIKGKDVLLIIEQEGVIEKALTSQVDDSNLARGAKVNLLNSNESMLQISVKSTDPAICRDAVMRIGTAIFEAIFEYRFKLMDKEKTYNENLLVCLDESVAEYLQNRDKKITELLEEDPVYKRLLEEKAACLVRLKTLGFNLKELSEAQPMESDIWMDGQDNTALMVHVNKKAYLAVAALLGLMISSTILFICHFYFTGKPAATDPPEKID